MFSSTEKESIYKKIFEQRPLLKTLMEKYGKETLKSYANNNLKGLTPTHTTQSQQLIDVIQDISRERLGEDTAQEIKSQLENLFFASTADHHGIINSNLAASSNILLNEMLLSQQNDHVKYNMVFSCASVSLNNEDYPRGIIFHSLDTNDYIEEKLSILPSNSHGSTVYNFRAYKAEEIVKIKSAFEKTTKPKLKTEQTEDINNFLNNILLKKDILESKNFCEQITKINFILWPLLFKNNPTFKPLVYIEQEEITNRLLTKYLLKNENIIKQLIFNNEYAELLNKLSAAIEKFLRQGSLATYLFWYLTPDKNQRKKLLKEGEKLVTEDGLYQIAFTPEAVADAINKGELMPNLLLVYSVLHLYAKLGCAGGFNQIHYLAEMEKIFQEYVGEPMPTADTIPYFYGVSVVNFKDKSKEVAPYTLDILLYPEQISNEIYHNLNNKTFQEIFDENIKIIHDIIS
ncbi:MAG: hypothetical protein NT034_02720 [Candidatus Magasanikbacteria bacterium]|nr:hypothetical protein [Candidatus Magasanikbacteria bacterium]